MGGGKQAGAALRLVLVHPSPVCSRHPAVSRNVYKMGTVGRLTGLSPALLRAWERRYSFLTPQRGPGRQRLYTDEDLAVLRRVRQLTDEGRSIGEVAALGRRALLAAARPPAPAPELVQAGASLLPSDAQRVMDAQNDAVVAAGRDGLIVYANRAARELLGWRPDELIGQPLTVLMPSRMKAAHRVGLERYFTTRVPRLIGRTVRVPAVTRSGQEIEVDLSLGIQDDMVVASLRALRDPVGVEGTRSLAAAVKATTLLAARLQPDQVLGSVVDSLVADFDAALARIWVLDAANHQLLLRASAGLSRQTTGSSRARIDLRTYPYKVGIVARSGQPFVRNGLLGDPHFDQAWVTRERVASAAVLPLTCAGVLVGVIASFFRQPISDETLDILGALASVVGASLPPQGQSASRHT
ncbi:MAG: MerR family transcriptional regulator [Myxococcales bacterium]|nr:MerR family transcriptional regulator [Myxococcales bacterium]